MSDQLQKAKSLDERVSFLETELKVLKERLSKLEEPKQESLSSQPLQPATPPANIERGNSPISVTLVRKTFHKGNFMLGDVGDRIDFAFLFQSHLTKDVRAFNGSVIIKDLFDQDILRVTLTHETGLSAKGTTVWNGGIRYNQFLDTHQRLLTVEQDDIAISFACENIIYADGSREGPLT